MNQKEHYPWIDLARIVAIIFAVLCHATENIYQMDLSYLPTISSLSRGFAFTSFTIGRMGVPIFLMITGYLLLDREYSGEKYVSFLKKNWLHLMFCTWIWFAIYELFTILYHGVAFTPLQIIEDLLFIRTVSMGHTWYMPMILGIYLLIPLAANALHSIENKYLRWPLLILVFFAFGFPLFNVISNALTGTGLSLMFSLGFSGGAYGMFVLIGYLVKKGTWNRIPAILLILVVILSVGIGAWFQSWAYRHNYRYNIWYDFPAILIGSVAFFLLLSRINSVRMPRVRSFLSCHSFGVYLIHFMILCVLRPVAEKMGLIMPLKVILLWIVVIAASYAVSWCISCVPKIGKYILYEK